MPHLYICCKDAAKWGDRFCTRVEGRELDKMIEKIVLQVLKAPPVEVLKQALLAATRAEEIKANELDAERQHIERRERLIRQQFGQCDPLYKLLFDDLQEQLNSVLEEKKKFQERVAAERDRPKMTPTAEHIEELCSMASNIPEIWHHALVTPHDKKEIIRCLIKLIIVTKTPETFDGKIEWTSGAWTDFSFYRWQSRNRLVKELHAQGYNSKEILHRLATGQTSTGQAMTLHPETLKPIYTRFGLTRNRKPSWFNSLRDEAVKLLREGKSCRSIADLFNSHGTKSLSGNQWSQRLVYHLIETVKWKADLTEAHRVAFLEAKRQKLNYTQMAQEFNRNGVPTENQRPWTPGRARSRWLKLKTGTKK